MTTGLARSVVLAAATVAIVGAVAASSGCQRTPAAKLVQAPKYEPPNQAKCSVQASYTRPLVVEWPAGDRASLEARLARGLVAVHAAGCEIEVLRQCTVPGTYSYLGLTRKNEQVTIRDADDLYAKLPLGAVNLEAKLARSGRLDVKMALVGILEAPGAVDRGALIGDCGRATHVISAAQLGAFMFSAGGSAEIGAGVTVKTVGVGGSSSSEQELLSADGDPARCDAATGADERPPDGCGAVLRIELMALGAPTCADGSRWDGQRCVVAQVFCPQGTDVVAGRCVSRAPAPVQATPVQATPTQATPVQATPASSNPDEAVCRDYCSLELRCKAEKEGTPPPEGQGLTRMQRMCQRMCEFGTTDYNRPALRKCVSEGCSGLLRCTTKFAG
jgi:hypothetical protein